MTKAQQTNIIQALWLIFPLLFNKSEETRIKPFCLLLKGRKTNWFERAKVLKGDKVSITSRSQVRIPFSRNMRHLDLRSAPVMATTRKPKFIPKHTILTSCQNLVWHQVLVVLTLDPTQLSSAFRESSENWEPTVVTKAMHLPVKSSLWSQLKYDKGWAIRHSKAVCNGQKNFALSCPCTNLQCTTNDFGCKGEFSHCYICNASAIHRNHVGFMYHNSLRETLLFFYFIPLSSYFFPPSCKQLIIKLHLNYKLPTLGGKILLEILKGWYVKIGEKQLFWKCCLFLCSECYLNIGRGPH